MKRVFLSASIVLLLVISAFGGREGVLTAGSADERESLASIADWYTAQSYSISGETDSVITVTANWPGYVLKGFYNTDTSDYATARLITVAGDTVAFPIGKAAFSGRVPPVGKLMKNGTSDNLILMFQKR